MLLTPTPSDNAAAAGEPLPLTRENALAALLARSDAPLVSVIVRSMDRPELDEALASIERQIYPNIEVVVVNAKGPEHRVLPDRCGRFPLRGVGSGEALGRSRAANVGLAEARGDYLIFLDDDDWFLANHVAGLVACLEANPNAQVAYAGVVASTPDGSMGDVFNEPFSAPALRCGNFIPLHAALLRTQIRDRGFRFDESLEVFEDWDLWLQLSRQGPFVHLDHVSACYRQGGRSGVGLTAESELQKGSRTRIFEKWRHLWTAAELEEVAAERNELALRLRAQREKVRGALSRSEARVGELEGMLLRIHGSWSFTLTRPLRPVKSLLRQAKRRLTRAPRQEENCRPHISTLERPVSIRDVSGPLISAIVPVFNACRSNPRYLREALESIVCQTCRRLELIIVDDGSTDDTPTVCQHFTDSHTGFPVRYYRKENGGQSSARNVGIRMARGEWVGFLDQDDAWFPSKLERIVPLLSDSVDIVYTDSDTMDDQSRLELVGLHRNYRFGLPHPKKTLEDCLFKDVFVMPGVATYRRELLLRIGGFDERLSGYEDDDLFVRLFPLARVAYLPESTLWWRIYRDNYSNTPRMIRSRLAYWRKLMGNYTDGGRNRARVAGISRRFAREFLNQAMLQRRDGKAFFRENLSSMREIVPYLPLMDRWAFGYPRGAWTWIGAHCEPVRHALEHWWWRAALHAALATHEGQGQPATAPGELG